MELKQIDKTLYKQRLNRFQAVLVAGLFVVGIGSSSLYISLFGAGDESNFIYNLAGVITAVIVAAIGFNIVKEKTYMMEIRYVWKLKQELNRIYRASKKLEAGLTADDDSELLSRALIVRYFSLHGSKHLYQLEDNTLTLDDLNTQIEEFDQRLETLGKAISTDDYRPELVDAL
ncbi:DUF3087 family protein [Bacterioplanoides sp. SCSIO 12839]|uniref:DUF3087 family protein n=1 Tax=Bacterioplanoides sp. SCSIO 12839 TaxID=2829569 RepID=UPI0021049615|nr:DUF3087 family protein [Bacterioplanoides sp. SCSIO 12839]UTW49257.1 DUF3087 family protein [Bacterioplanoides sp. SCSIO 12839]